MREEIHFFISSCISLPLKLKFFKENYKELWFKIYMLSSLTAKQPTQTDQFFLCLYSSLVVFVFFQVKFTGFVSSLSSLIPSLYRIGSQTFIPWGRFLHYSCLFFSFLVLLSVSTWKMLFYSGTQDTSVYTERFAIYFQ